MYLPNHARCPPGSAPSSTCGRFLLLPCVLCWVCGSSEFVSVSKSNKNLILTPSLEEEQRLFQLVLWGLKKSSTSEWRDRFLQTKLRMFLRTTVRFYHRGFESKYLHLFHQQWQNVYSFWEVWFVPHFKPKHTSWKMRTWGSRPDLVLWVSVIVPGCERGNRRRSRAGQIETQPTFVEFFKSILQILSRFFFLDKSF